MRVEIENKDDLKEIEKFGQTGILTEDALCVLGEMFDSWETRIDDIWGQLPASETGGTQYTDGYRITAFGIEAYAEEGRCGYIKRYDATIPFRLFADENYTDRLREMREEEARKAKEAAEQRAKEEQRNKERQERAQLKKLKEKYEDG